MPVHDMQQADDTYETSFTHFLSVTKNNVLVDLKSHKNQHTNYLEQESVAREI